jgi:hypothetical protein
VRSLGVNINGKETLIPTVRDDGKMMSDDEAISHYRKTGKHLGKFASRETADRYAKRLHGDQEEEIKKPRKLRLTWGR